MNILISAICVGLGLASAAVGASACSDADTAALEAFDRAWGEAGNKGDREALERFLADDFMGLGVGEARGKQASIEQSVADSGEARPGDPVAVPDFYTIHCDAGSAMITHRNVLADASGDPAKTWYGRSIHHLVKRDGTWRVLSTTSHELGDADTVKYLDLEWNRADMAADKAWFERMLADDYIGIPSRTGKPEDKAEAIAGLGAISLTQAETTDLEATVHGDTARVTGIYHTRGTNADGSAFHRRTRYIDMFVRRDGRWLVWSSQGTEVRD